MTPEERSAHQQRLNILKVQRAQHELDCPPHIQTEIEDIERLLGRETEKPSVSQNRYTRIGVYIVSRMSNINRLFDELLKAMITTVLRRLLTEVCKSAAIGHEQHLLLLARLNGHFGCLCL
jgi:hypothetical protein